MQRVLDALAVGQALERRKQKTDRLLARLARLGRDQAGRVQVEARKPSAPTDQEAAGRLWQQPLRPFEVAIGDGASGGRDAHLVDHLVGLGVPDEKPFAVVKEQALRVRPRHAAERSVGELAECRLRRVHYPLGELLGLRQRAAQVGAEFEMRHFEPHTPWKSYRAEPSELLALGTVDLRHDLARFPPRGEAVPEVGAGSLTRIVVLAGLDARR